MGASQIKISAGGGVSSLYDPLDVRQYTKAELEAFVEVADTYNTYVLAHIFTDEAAQIALQALVVLEAGQRQLQQGAEPLGLKAGQLQGAHPGSQGGAHLLGAHLFSHQQHRPGLPLQGVSQLIQQCGAGLVAVDQQQLGRQPLQRGGQGVGFGHQVDDIHQLAAQANQLQADDGAAALASVGQQHAQTGQGKEGRGHGQPGLRKGRAGSLEGAPKKGERGRSPLSPDACCGAYFISKCGSHRVSPGQ